MLAAPLQVMAWGRNDDGQLGRGHTEHDSCHLEVKTELPARLALECGTEAVNGSLDLGRLHLCNILPGNSTSLAAGERHSGAVTRSNYTWRDPSKGYTYGDPDQPQSYQVRRATGGAL
jgi:alpha-tubulin suppressor-like RCC1 family protein